MSGADVLGPTWNATGERFTAPACAACVEWASDGAKSVAYYTGADCRREEWRGARWREERARYGERRVHVRLSSRRARPELGAPAVCLVCGAVPAERVGVVVAALWITELDAGDVVNIDGEEHAVRWLDGPDVGLVNGRRVPVSACTYVRRGSVMLWVRGD